MVHFLQRFGRINDIDKPIAVNRRIAWPVAVLLAIRAVPMKSKPLTLLVKFLLYMLLAAVLGFVVMTFA